MRLITRADWDGLVCAALLKLVEDIDEVVFIEPGPFQSGELTVTSRDLIANLPFRSGCGMWFDHHATNKTNSPFQGAWRIAPSAARVIFEYYDRPELRSFAELVDVTDIIDSAALTEQMVLNPQGYVLASMTVEGKRLDNEPYWQRLIDLIGRNEVRALIADSEVEDRCRELLYINEEYGQVIQLYSEQVGNVLVTDFRQVWHGEPGNRFLAFSLYPDCDVWVKAMDHPNDPTRTHIAVGHSIFRRTSPVHIGDLMARFGGGGHRGAGSCRPLIEDADTAIEEIVKACLWE